MKSDFYMWDITLLNILPTAGPKIANKIITTIATSSMISEYSMKP